LALIGLLLAVGSAISPTLAAGPVHDSSLAVSSAGSTIVNGWYVNDSSAADEYGEMSCELTSAGFPSVFTGIPVDSMQNVDTIQVAVGYAMSSLESLNVADDTTQNTPYDTIFFKYWVQNQGNGPDSIRVVVSINDTNDFGYFTPVDFDLVGPDSSTVLSTALQVDSIQYTVGLAQEGIDTFLVRIVIPGPLTAADEESLRFGVRVLDNNGTGTYDAWPGTLATGEMARAVLDTFEFPHLLHTIRDAGATFNDTMWEYGDSQYVENFLTINAPVMRLAKTVNASGALPGDTLTYTIYYDNDGSAWTEDTVNIIDRFPKGIVFLDTISHYLDQGGMARGLSDQMDLEYLINDSTWIEDMPGVPESLLLVTGIKYQIPEGIGRHDTTGGDQKGNVIADGDSVSRDSGFMRFQVRIR
jgi:uncharacterized repeat protein (TIGR01451 family)